MNSQRTKAHTLPSRTSRHTSQSLAKSVLFPTQKEIQFFFSLPSVKIKSPDTQTNLTKTVKHNKDNGLQTQWKERQLVTAAWRNWGRRDEMNICTSNKHLWFIDSFVLRNPLLRKAANR
jgi:hypothetical protein